MSSARILVVEDEFIVARDIRMQLTELGYEPVGHATRGEQAVSMAESLRPDLVLMDVRLADATDGISAAEQIRSRLALPVVFLTAFGGDDTLQRAKQSDPFGYILKPFSERELHTVIEMALYRHQAEARLRDSEQRFRTLVEWTPEASLVHREGFVVYANPSALRLFGAATLTHLVGLPISTLIHPDSLHEQMQRVRSINSGLAVAPMVEASLVRLDGSAFDAEVRGTRIDYDGAPAVYVVVRDITARKAAEAQLRKLSLVVEQSTQSILITDVDGCIEYVNRAFERITGYRSADALGRHPSFLGSSSNPEQAIDGLWATLRSGQSWRGELINQRRDGSEYTAHLLAVPLRQSDGRITNYLQLHDDISDQMRLAAELDLHRNHLEAEVASRTAELIVARHQADTANQAKSAFLANMSHEIRTPMNAIMGLSQLLRRATPTPEQAESLDKITAASQHMMGILNDVLDLSKIEAGRVELEQADFELSTLLDQVASIVGESARAKGLALAMDAHEMTRWLRGDATRLRQALLNYAGNAVKFTERGTIALRVHVLEQIGKSLLLRFEVQDSGPGIAPERLARLFQDFEQGDNSITRQHGGTGLGLAITRRLAHMMGGEAGAESTPGSGSTFWFTARLQLGEPTAATTQHGLHSDAAGAEMRLRKTHAGARILLAEDNLVNRELALAWLQDLGLVVDSACDGLEAVDQARDQLYDLVLMDMQMPEMDGLEATRAIRKLPRWQTVPIIALTANAFDESHRACEAAGMNDLITKPVGLPALCATLERWLAGRAMKSD